MVDLAEGCCLGCCSSFAFGLKAKKVYFCDTEDLHMWLTYIFVVKGILNILIDNHTDSFLFHFDACNLFFKSCYCDHQLFFLSRESVSLDLGAIAQPTQRGSCIQTLQVSRPVRATAFKSWMSRVSPWREVDRRRYRPWRWQTLRDRTTKEPRSTMDQNDVAAPRKALEPQSNTNLNTAAHFQSWMDLRILKSLSWILMIMTCLSQSTASWGHPSSLSVSWPYFPWRFTTPE